MDMGKQSLIVAAAVRVINHDADGVPVTVERASVGFATHRGPVSDTHVEVGFQTIAQFVVILTIDIARFVIPVVADVSQFGCRLNDCRRTVPSRLRCRCAVPCVGDCTLCYYAQQSKNKRNLPFHISQS